MLTVLREIQESTRNEAVLFLIQYPALNAEIWMSTLKLYFTRCKLNASQFHIDNEGEDVNVAVFYTGGSKTDVEITAVNFCEAPPPSKDVHFGRVLFLVEIRYLQSRESTIGLLWAPNLRWRGHEISLSQTWFEKVSAYLLMWASMYRSKLESYNETEIKRKLREMARDWAGVLIIMDAHTRSLGTWRRHMWMVDGNVHVTQGTFVENEFMDLPKLPIAKPPACYRVRPTKFKYALGDHSFSAFSDLRAEFGFATLIRTDRHQLLVQSDVASSSIDDQQKRMPLVAKLVLAYVYKQSAIRDRGPTHCDEDVHGKKTVMEEPHECMVCLDRPATMIFAVCGHFGVCGLCRKWLCKEQYLKNKSKAMSPSEVKMGKAAKTAVSCPICRYVTKIVFRADHRGRLQFIV